jgi:hypothetical protein
MSIFRSYGAWLAMRLTFYKHGMPTALIAKPALKHMKKP